MELRLYELDDSHGCRIASAEASLENASVSAFAIDVAWSYLVEDAMHDIFVVDVCACLPAQMHCASQLLLGRGVAFFGLFIQRFGIAYVAFFANGDQFFCFRLQSFRLRERCDDLIVAQKLGSKRSQKRFALIVGASKLIAR